MSRKNVLRYHVSEAQSLAADFKTAATILKYQDNCSYQINVTTSDSSGTFAVEVSNDYETQEPTNAVINPGNWITIDLSGVPTVSGADDSIIIDLNQLPFNAIRLSYTAGTPGTGVADIWLNCKTVGA